MSVERLIFTLPGPDITASVTLPQVRACMRRHGWQHVGPTDDGGGEAWERGGTLRLTIYDRDRYGREARASAHGIVVSMAHHARITPGEMLLQIAAEPG